MCYSFIYSASICEAQKRSIKLLCRVVEFNFFRAVFLWKKNQLKFSVLRFFFNFENLTWSHQMNWSEQRIQIHAKHLAITSEFRLYGGPEKKINSGYYYNVCYQLLSKIRIFNPNPECFKVYTLYCILYNSKE